MTRRRPTITTTYYVSSQRHTLLFPGTPASLRALSGGPRGLLFDFIHSFDLVESPRAGWQATTRRYQYRLLDHEQRELLVYHWQPGPEFHGPDHPHLHVSASLNARTDAINQEAIDLDKIHLPTGLMTLAAVVRLLIQELEVAPVRRDWKRVLARNEAILRSAIPEGS